MKAERNSLVKRRSTVESSGRVKLKEFVEKIDSCAEMMGEALEHQSRPVFQGRLW